MSDWSDWTARPIRAIVKSRACPTCGAKKGLPCRNQLHGIHGPPGGFKRKQRPLYQNYVHRARRAAGENLNAKEIRS